MRTRSTVCFMLSILPLILSQCPQNNKTLVRIGRTRYFIIQNTQQRGDFVTIEQARKDCSKHGLKLATVKNLLSLAVVGRPLEKMASEKRMKDTWYWLDAKYDTQSQRYHWGDDIKDELKYTLILYRTPRPIGVSSHITYNNVYQKDEDKPQCLTLALPWLGTADHHENTTVFFGHQTSFDERDCKSKQKRHAMCEAQTKDCQPTESSPFVLNEEKHDYFEQGNWIFGDRKYVVNWKQRTINQSELYCKSLGLQLMNAGALEKFLIPHIKMWSREITASQFWTGMSYNDETKQYMDSFGNIIANDNVENNFTETEFQSRSSKDSPIFCVALSLAYEFRSQMPCKDRSSSACQWSFIRYAPANCNNYHGTICQHPDYDTRDVKWYPDFKSDLDDVLKKTALTPMLEYKGYNFTFRSKYKQTFGLCYCPKDFRMIRSHNNSNLAWSVKPVNTTGKEINHYDYMESYWMVDKDLYNKDENSKCTVSYSDKGIRKFKEVKCTEWHFYLCERLGRRPPKPLDITINKAPPMKWEEGPQPRVYPLVSTQNSSIHDRLCKCKLENDGNEWNTVKNQCVKRVRRCSSNAFNHNHCQRGGYYVFYAIGGDICNSYKPNDRCTFEKVIYTLSSTYNETDNKGIHYEKDIAFDKRWNISSKLWSAHYMSNYNENLVPVRDARFYGTCLVGNAQNLPSPNPTEKDGCPTLLFEINGDGRYEISLKFLDYKANPKVAVYKRAFSVLLNDMYIAREFNPNDYRLFGQGIEFIANFRIFGNESMLELQGHPSITLKEKTLKLEICYSFCARVGYEADPNWIVNSVSILKFSSKPDDPCECRLKNITKEYHTVTKQCIDDFSEADGCGDFHFNRDYFFCKRHGHQIHYAIYGTICHPENTDSLPNCKVGKTIYAINFGGKNETDARGILHYPLNKGDWQVKEAVWHEGKSKLPVEDVPLEDLHIYKTWAHGFWIHINKSRSVELGCAVLLFKTDGDGYYEISMKTGELFYSANEKGNRVFSVILNDMYIVKEFVVESYLKSPHGLELVANFRIFHNGTILELQGHPHKEIKSDQKLQLEVCHSNCDGTKLGFWVDRNWVLYGLSIIKFYY